MLEVLYDSSERYTAIHCASIPGLYAWGDRGAALALELQRELLRFKRCYPWLRVPAETSFVVQEKINAGIFLSEGESATLFGADRCWTQERQQLAYRLLLESAEQLRRCYDSIPDKTYDLAAGEDAPGWIVTTGEAALQDFLVPLNHCLAIVGIPAVTSGDWVSQLTEALDKLMRPGQCMTDGRLTRAQQDVCIGQWLRYLVERCQLSGSRMYRLGVAAFGCTIVCDSFCLGPELQKKSENHVTKLYPTWDEDEYPYR